MKCAEVRENLAAYLDGEIEGAPRRAVDEHLAACPACAAERRAQAAAWRLLDLAAPPAVPAHLAAKVVARARAEGAAPRGRFLRLPLPAAAAAAAAVLLLAGGAALFLRDDGERSPVSPGEGPGDRVLEDLAVLESMDVLQDDAVEAVDRITDLGDEDLAVLGG